MSAKHFSNGNPAQPGGYGSDDEREQQLFDAVEGEGYNSSDASYNSPDAGYGSHFAGGSGAGSYADTPSDDASFAQPAGGVGMSDGFATMPSSDYSRDSGRYTSGGHHHHHHHKHLALKIVLAVLAVVNVAGGVVGFQVYQSVKQVKADAQTVVATGKELANKIKGGDTTGLSADAAKISQAVSKMREETDGPIWQALSHVPAYGSDVAAASCSACSTT